MYDLFDFEKERKMNFQDKVVVITGGAHGIGLCAADEFKKYGAHVCVIEYSRYVSITYPVNWKSLLICLFVHTRLSFYENLCKGCYAPLMRQGLYKDSPRKGQLIKHK